MLKIPYGISDFKSLRKENYLYIDKTNFIETIEELDSKYLFFIRPRRFGKSLFLSTLAHYYDMNNKDEFEDMFKDLYISKNPSELKTSYIVLQFNFSGLNTDSKEELRNSFRLTLLNAIIDTLYKYPYVFKNIKDIENNIKSIKDIKGILEYFLKEVKRTSEKIYLIVDEYDHFANDIIAMGDGDFYRDIIRARGFVRDFYETVKIGTESVIDRIFITGISPVMLDDLTSGFNISTNITMSKLFNEILGFTEEEVKGIIEKVARADDIDLDKEQLLLELRKNYNGYLFNKDSKKRLYNPDMILHFFNQYLMTGDYPDQLIDDNVRTDYGRINRLVANEVNREVLEDIILEEGIVADIITRFSFDMMYDEDYFVSLLFYMGLLTIDKKYRTRTLLKIPNFVVKTIFWEYIEKRLSKQYQLSLNTNDLRKSIEDMAYEGDIKPYIDYLSKHVFKHLSNRDLINFDEKYIKVILFAYLVDSMAYKPYSESEVGNGYIDIYLEKDLRIPDIKYEWIIELKYLKKADKDKLADVKEEGLRQLQEYANSRKFAEKDDIKKALVIFIGKDEYFIYN
ncbi:AAA family ATPase [Natronospora cellulosivora (SeqCode)]